MKKLVLVLALGLTFMSCSKEDLPIAEVEEDVIVETCEGKYTVTGFGYREDQFGWPIWSIGITNEVGEEEWLRVSKSEYDAINLEQQLNGIVCWEL